MKDTGSYNYGYMEEQPPVKCPFCDKVLTTEHNANYHIRIGHGGSARNAPKKYKTGSWMEFARNMNQI